MHTVERVVGIDSCNEFFGRLPDCILGQGGAEPATCNSSWGEIGSPAANSSAGDLNSSVVQIVAKVPSAESDGEEGPEAPRSARTLGLLVAAWMLEVIVTNASALIRHPTVHMERQTSATRARP